MTLVDKVRSYGEDLTEDEHAVAALEALDDKGYEIKGKESIPEWSEVSLTFKRNSDTAGTLTYETGNQFDNVRLSVLNEVRSDYDLSDLDEENIQEFSDAVEYLNSSEVSYETPENMVVANIDSQETPEETGTKVRETAEAIQTVADIRAALS